MSGWTKLSSGSLVKISADVSASTAAITACSLSPVSAPAVVGTVPSPSNATARARSIAPTPRLASRSSARRLTDAGRKLRTRCASDRSGANRLSPASRSSSISRNGLPLVTSWQAATKSCSGRLLKCAATTSFTASGPSGRGRSTRALAASHLITPSAGPCPAARPAPRAYGHRRACGP